MKEEEYNELKDVELHFECLYEGCYTYVGELNGTPVTFYGGRASYEDAYYLELEKTHKLSELCCTPKLWDVKKENGEIIVSPNAIYYY